MAYTPAANYNGSDSFTVEVDDGNGGTATVTVNVAVESINDIPAATNNSYTTDEDTAVSGNVLTDGTADSDADGDTLSVTAWGTPAHGSLSATAANGSFTYTPDAGYNGSDSFTYTIEDGNGGSASATVSITVNAVNDLPVISEGSSVAVTMSEDGSPTAFALTLHADDADDDPLSWRVSTPPSHGSADATGSGTSQSVAYTPAANYNGSDSFTVEVDDGNGGTATVTVNVAVESINDIPAATNNSYTTDEDTAVSGNVLTDGTADSDADGDTLSVTAWGTPAHGSLSATAANGSFTYTPDAGYNGSDSFTYTIEDGNGGSASATVSIVANSHFQRIELGSQVEIDGTVTKPYLFELKEPMTIKLYSEGNVDSTVVVKDANGTIIASLDDFEGNENFYWERSLLPGIYIVEAEIKEGALGSYMLHLDSVNPSNPSIAVPLQNSVSKLYVATFNRAPDAAGLDYWVNDSGLTIDGVASSFFDQPETQAKYPAGLSNTDFVTTIYYNLFNREPDEGGLLYWTGELDRYDASQGTEGVPRSKMILAMINGAQNTEMYGNDATILTNKTIVANAFANAGLNDVEEAKLIMQNIGDSVDRVYEALARIEIWKSAL